MTNIENIEKLIRSTYPETGDSFLDFRYDPNSPYYRFFYELAREIKPSLVVELGGWQGTGAAHFAPFSEKVITIDHHSDPGDEEHKKKMFEVVQRFPNVLYLQGWTTDAFVLNTVIKYAPIDLLFIDSWHHYDKAWEDYNIYTSLMRPGGIIICDDIIGGEDPQAPIFGMRRFWDEVSKPYPRLLSKELHVGFPMGVFIK